MGGDAASNPMRQAIHEAAALLGPCFSVSHLLGGPGQIFRVRAGMPTRCRTSLPPKPGSGSGPGDAAGGHRGRGESPLAGRPDAELQGPAPSSGGVPAGRRARGPLLDRSRGDRPLLPAAGDEADRGDRRRRGLGDPPPVPLAERVLSAAAAPQPRSCSDGRASWSSTAPSWSTPRPPRPARPPARPGPGLQSIAGTLGGGPPLPGSVLARPPLGPDLPARRINIYSQKHEQS